MPAPLMTKPEMLGRLLDLFRDNGFDGASLSDISDATGLGKSSLYHHFPNGKEEIALQVLAFLEEQLEQALFEPMRPPERQEETRSHARYDRRVLRGREKSLPARAAVRQRRRQRFPPPLGRAFSTWIDAVEALGVESGLPRAVARTPRRRSGGPHRGRACGVRREPATPASSRARFASSAKSVLRTGHAEVRSLQPCGVGTPMRLSLPRANGRASHLCLWRCEREDYFSSSLRRSRADVASPIAAQRGGRGAQRPVAAPPAPAPMPQVSAAAIRSSASDSARTDPSCVPSTSRRHGRGPGHPGAARQRHRAD
jgi:AcrR family transcriptional regulator